MYEYVVDSSIEFNTTVETALSICWRYAIANYILSMFIPHVMYQT